MIKFHIDSKKLGGKYWLEFSSREEADAYKEQVKASAHWGKPAWTEEVTSEDGTVTVVEHAAEYSITEEDITGLREQEQANREALAYLAATDWLVIRQLDSGEPMPADVKQKRAEARAKIV